MPSYAFQIYHKRPTENCFIACQFKFLSYRTLYCIKELQIDRPLKYKIIGTYTLDTSCIIMQLPSFLRSFLHCIVQWYTLAFISRGKIVMQRHLLNTVSLKELNLSPNLSFNLSSNSNVCLTSHVAFLS